MRKHRLHLFQQISRRISGRLLALLFVLLALAAYDFWTEALGDNWFYLWIEIGVIFLFWLFYRFAERRAYVQARPDHLRLQGPLGPFSQIRISYGRVHSATAAQFAQHFPHARLSAAERRVLEPMYGATCLFVELTSLPPSFRGRSLWFPRVLFGVARPGVLLAVDDWMALSRDIEIARTHYQTARQRQSNGDRRTLAARVLDDSLTT
jgi:hypothetical protein